MSEIDALYYDNIGYLHISGEVGDLRSGVVDELPYIINGIHTTGSFIPIYGLLMDTNEGFGWVSQFGDFTIGGGIGEHSELIINIPDVLLYMGIIDSSKQSELRHIKVDDYPSESNGVISCAWSFSEREVIQKSMEIYGYDSEKYLSLESFLAMNLISFLYNTFLYKKSLRYLPKVKFKLPNDKALHGNMFRHYTESVMRKGKIKEWYGKTSQCATTGSDYFMPIEMIRDIKIGGLINE